MRVKILQVKVLRLSADLFCADEDMTMEALQRDLDTLYSRKEHKGEIALVDADTPQAAALIACNLDVYYGAVAVRDGSSKYYIVVRSCPKSLFKLGRIIKPDSVKRSPDRDHDPLLS